MRPSAAGRAPLLSFDIDEHFALVAGFLFLRADAAAHRAWGPTLFPDLPA